MGRVAVEGVVDGVHELARRWWIDGDDGVVVVEDEVWQVGPEVAPVAGEHAGARGSD